MAVRCGVRHKSQKVTARLLELRHSPFILYLENTAPETRNMRMRVCVCAQIAVPVGNVFNMPCVSFPFPTCMLVPTTRVLLSLPLTGLGTGLHAVPLELHAQPAVGESHLGLPLLQQVIRALAVHLRGGGVSLQLVDVRPQV